MNGPNTAESPVQYWRAKIRRMFVRQYQPVDDFGEGVSFFLADTVNDDVSLAGKPA